VTAFSNALFFVATSCSWLVAFAASGASGVTPGVTSSALKLKLGVSELTDTNCIIEVSVLNTGSKPLTVFQNDLPWMSRHSLFVVVVQSGPEKRLIEEHLFIDDPKAGQVTIKPGESLNGHIEISRRFPTLLESLEEKDVFLFWSYELKCLGKPLGQRTGGFLLLPSKENRRKP
jgi:hypothetical protein